MEKCLNLLFTVAIATIIGLASLHLEQNFLVNLWHRRRLIFDANEMGGQVLADVLRFIESPPSAGGFTAIQLDPPSSVEPRARAQFDVGKYVSPEQSSWVSDYCHGSTKIGRPVQLHELSESILSVSSIFELRILRRGVARKLVIRSDGMCLITGHVANAGDCKTSLTSCLRIA